MNYVCYSGMVLTAVLVLDNQQRRSLDIMDIRTSHGFPMCCIMFIMAEEANTQLSPRAAQQERLPLPEISSLKPA